MFPARLYATPIRLSIIQQKLGVRRGQRRDYHILMQVTVVNIARDSNVVPCCGLPVEPETTTL